VSLGGEATFTLFLNDLLVNFQRKAEVNICWAQQLKTKGLMADKTYKTSINKLFFRDSLIMHGVFLSLLLYWMRHLFLSDLFWTFLWLGLFLIILYFLYYAHFVVFISTSNDILIKQPLNFLRRDKFFNFSDITRITVKDIEFISVPSFFEIEYFAEGKKKKYVTRWHTKLVEMQGLIDHLRNNEVIVDIYSPGKRLY
jgi:hypothetical protein